LEHPPTRLSSFAPPEPLWARYTFAVASSVLAWVLELWLNSLLAVPITPLLPAFAAVIASAAWAGFGPGIVATVLMTTWSAVDLHTQHHLTPTGEIIRCALFAGEGLLLSIGSARLRRATREAARSEDWHRRLIETSGEGIWVTDSEARIAYANPRIAEILGAEVEEVVGRKTEEFFFPADLSVERIRFQNLRKGLKEQFDRRLRRKDGGEAWVLACCNSFPNRPSEFLGVLAMMTDITERKRAEYALRRSEERFRGLFENVLEGVYQSTPDGRILAANPMLLRMLGLAHEAELNDVNIAKDLYVDPNVRKRLLERLERDGSFQNVEYQLRRRDGIVITVHENARVVRDEEGRVLYYEGTLTDITERKRIEEQLRQAQKMEALGRLAGGIAHDFSNVLTIISGYARLVTSELAPGHPARSSAEQMVKAADGAAGLTRQLLTFSRRQKAPVATVDLNRVIARSIESLRRTLGEQAAADRGKLLLSLTHERTPVCADEGHIEQIVLNLAMNARHALPAADALEVKTEVVKLDASLCRQYPGTRPGEYVVISLRLIGPDAAGATSTVIPDAPSGEGPDGATFGAEAGFGVGTTQAIVSQYGGFVVADRFPGRRTVFSVYLPFADESVSVSAADLTDAAMRRSRQETILLVDDEPLTRELCRDMLEREGYLVVLAADAREAERLCEQGNRFDLLIADLVMPHLSGPDLARKLRTATPGLKALFISGYADRNAAGAGASPSSAPTAGDTFLRKPFSVDSLGRKIRQIFDRP
jgi:PAS domain S-box-containing protein